MIKGSSIPNICVLDMNKLERKCKEFIEKTKLLLTNTDYNVSFFLYRMLKQIQPVLLGFFQ